MADIELDNLGEDRTEREQTEREEDTSFTEDTDNADAEYDNIRAQINLESNREILKALENAKVEYNASINAVIDESVGLSMSDVAAESVQERVVGSLKDLVWDKYNEISQSDPDKNIEREIRGIPYVDENIDYDDLGNSNQRTQ